jgi:L-fuconolactonase
MSTQERAPVVDAQIHLWHPDRPERPWPPDGRAHAHRGGVSPTVEELLAEMGDAGVDQVVLVPPSWAGDDNEACLQAAADHPDRFAVMGRLSLERPGDWRGALDRWRRQPGMLGVRLTFFRGPSTRWLSDGTADWFWPEAERAGIPVMVFVPGLLREIEAVASRHPGLRLVLDHAALPAQPPPIPVEEVIGEVVGLARHENVAVKASAFPTAVGEPYPFPTMQRAARRLVDAFGPHRVFWGSDLTRLPCTYRECASFLREPGGLEASELDWVMGRGIRTWLRWGE